MVVVNWFIFTLGVMQLAACVNGFIIGTPKAATMMFLLALVNFIFSTMDQ